MAADAVSCARALQKKETTRYSGTEAIHAGGERLGRTVGDFWAWSASDLLDNTGRGVLAEFLVGMAVGGRLDGVREGWAPFDLEAEGIKIEVKSAAYVQRWTQKKLSSIVFRVPKTLAWDADACPSRELCP